MKEYTKVNARLLGANKEREKKIAKLRRQHAAAAKRAEKASEARRLLPIGSTRARVTTANARWASAAGERDRIKDELAALGVKV